jgi:conjugal transfer pilus assembly protein TraL
MRNIPIPRYIDAPPQIFFWEIDEFMILATCMGVGIALGGLNTILGLIGGMFAAGQFAKYKNNGLPGQLNHLAHWFNIFNVNRAFKHGGVRSLSK